MHSLYVYHMVLLSRRRFYEHIIYDKLWDERDARDHVGWISMLYIA